MCDALKQPPPRPSLSHLDELVSHLRWLEMVGDKSRVLAGLTPAKIRHFAAEAQVLDAGELKDITEPKRYTLLLCLIHRAQIQGRDDPAEMFLKRVARFHVQAQQELECSPRVACSPARLARARLARGRWARLPNWKPGSTRGHYSWMAHAGLVRDTGSSGSATTRVAFTSVTRAVGTHAI